MVYGVQYEIYLNKQIDFFNDFLPICIDIRKMISIEKMNELYKLVIIPYNELDDRFVQREHSEMYASSLDNIHYYHQINRQSHPEIFKYYDVNMYTMYIKNSDNVNPYTEEMYQSLENKIADISNIVNSDDYLEKYSEQERNVFNFELNLLIEVFVDQRRNHEYFQEIKKIERELTNIKLTEEENELVLRVLNHPKLEGVIYSHGINLFT